MVARDPRGARGPNGIRVSAFATLAIAAACTTLPYSPCPVELEHGVPADAFERCKAVVRARYGGFVELDPVDFRLATDWLPVASPTGQRRASVFRDGDDLAVVVEARSLVEPPLGLPYWGSVRGDPAAERELAEQLRRVLEP